MRNTELRAITTPSYKQLHILHKLLELQNTQVNLLTFLCNDRPCYLKVNRGKLALINRPWKCKKGKDRRSPLVHSRKLAEHDNFTSAVSRRYRDRGQRYENPYRAKNQSDCRIRYRALLEKNKRILCSRGRNNIVPATQP